MKIIHRYILSEIMKSFLLIFFAIMMIVMISNFLDEIPMMVKHNPALTVQISYFFYKFPFLAAQAIPFALMLAILFSFSQFSRNNELTAIKSVGISYYSIMAPVLILSLCVSILNFAVNETLISASTEKSRYIREVLIEKKTDSKKDVQYDVAKLGEGGRVFYIRKLDILLGSINGICILQTGEGFTVTERLDAESGVWDNGRWVLKNGVIRSFENGREIEMKKFEEYNLYVKDTPDDFIVTKRSYKDILAISI
ncbi:MAG TPA: YjgP/YjgQ family permease, partial [bacterium]|nr:YjgP/YjgQ family permease [bacterium]